MSTSYSKVEFSKADIKVKSDLIAIDNRIEHIDVKGQYIQLAAPIHLSGQINAAKLSMEYKIPEQQINITENSDELVLKIGVDEAGRGPLLGSVHVAAAILPQAWSGLIEERPLNDTPLSILTDSKQLSEKKRDILYPLIKEHAIGYVVADIPAAVIDQINILQATMLGMRLCAEVLLEAIAGQVLQAPQSVFSSFNIETQILYDGNRCPDLDYSKLTKSGIDKAKIDCQAWVKGDARHTSIAAASILAKVSRDQTMYALDERHPQYAIAKHKGYPTKGHMEAINNYGVLPEHRRSFGPIKKALGNNLS